MNKSDSETTDFGFQQIPLADKAAKIGAVFQSVAAHYDVMNDLMSLGAHRYWKHFALKLTQLRPGQTALDLAAGSGDLALGLQRQVGHNGRVVVADINASMLQRARTRLLDAGLVQNIDYLQLDAEALPFPANYFDVITIGFGLRNVARKQQALHSMQRVLKPGGRLLVLEFSKPLFGWLQKAYDLYSFNVIPKLGEYIANDKDSYQYLVESIRMHPDQNTLTNLLREQGFDHVEVFNLSGGIVAVHRATKY